ncbi:hypothetical protein HAX54_045966 [Datura stramonium]|uniref:Uncharacterized protein n=1 Tax=Datura stramonium TaxID=4076 RepID=A0ABS8SRB0_DATST|nr:hypothetical protein [Datura stramonium]
MSPNPDLGCIFPFRCIQFEYRFELAAQCGGKVGGVTLARDESRESHGGIAARGEGEMMFERGQRGGESTEGGLEEANPPDGGWRRGRGLEGPVADGEWAVERREKASAKRKLGTVRGEVREESEAE